MPSPIRGPSCGAVVQKRWPRRGSQRGLSSQRWAVTLARELRQDTRSATTAGTPKGRCCFCCALQFDAGGRANEIDVFDGAADRGVAFGASARPGERLLRSRLPRGAEWGMCGERLGNWRGSLERVPCWRPAETSLRIEPQLEQTSEGLSDQVILRADHPRVSAPAAIVRRCSVQVLEAPGASGDTASMSNVNSRWWSVFSARASTCSSSAITALVRASSLVLS